VPAAIVDTAINSVKDSSLQASEYLKRIKRESEDAEALRRALEEERAAVAENFASLDKEAEKRERERQSTFDNLVQRTVADLEKRARELVTRIQDKTERVRAEREVQRQIPEIKRASSTEASGSIRVKNPVTRDCCWRHSETCFVRLCRYRRSDQRRSRRSAREISAVQRETGKTSNWSKPLHHRKKASWKSCDTRQNADQHVASTAEQRTVSELNVIGQTN
jgi:hypothetical protein